MSGEVHDMPRLQVVLFGTYLIVLNVVLLCLLFMIWPTTLPLKAENTSDTIAVLGITIDMAPERRYLLIAAVAGALGSYIHLATSFADYVGNRQLVSSWLWWYALRPFIGVALALLMYFVIRGGLIIPPVRRATYPLTASPQSPGSPACSPSKRRTS